jgi:capsular polysaccharide transport system permease protein
MLQTSLRTLFRDRLRPGTLRPNGNSQMIGDTERSIRIWLNVINALLIRDIRVRAGKFYIGYLVIFSMPFAHLAIMLLIVVVFFPRVTAFGNQPVIFYGISILPFVIFVYPARQVMMSLITVWLSRPLFALYY